MRASAWESTWPSRSSVWPSWTTPTPSGSPRRAPRRGATSSCSARRRSGSWGARARPPIPSRSSRRGRPRRRRAPGGRCPRPPRRALRADADRPGLRRHGAVLREVRRAARALREHDHRRLQEGAQAVRGVRGQGDAAARREPRRAAADGRREALVRVVRRDADADRDDDRRGHGAGAAGRVACVRGRHADGAALGHPRQREPRVEDPDLPRGVAAPALGPDRAWTEPRGPGRLVVGSLAMADEVLCSIADGVATVTLNRPAKRNALDRAVLAGLDACFEGFERDRALRVVVLRGAGPAFCAGMDLDELAARQDEEVDPEAGVVATLRRIERCRHPTLAVVHGDAFAGGLELALHCDLRLAADGARFAMPLARLGLVVPFALGQKLVEVVGPAMARQILLVGRPLSARRAHEIGMVHEVVPAADLERASGDLARAGAGAAPLSLAGMKQTILRGLAGRGGIER